MKRVTLIAVVGGSLLATASCRQILGIKLCDGGYCPDGGVSNVIALETNQVVNSNIAIDAKAVYWSDGSSVFQCSIGGCGAVPIMLASEQSSVSVLTVDSTNAYWASGGSIVKCATAGCDYSPTVIATGYSVGSIAVDATNIYWATNSQVLQCNLTTGCAADAGPTATILATAISPGALVTKNGNLYFSDTASSSNPEITVCAAGTCTHLVNTAQQLDQGIAVDSTSAYWGEGDGIYTCTLSGCNQTRICATPTNAAAPDYTAVDSTRVFFILNDGLGLCPISGLPTTQATALQLTTDVGDPTSILAFVIDATNIYLVGSDGIYQATKPSQ